MASASIASGGAPTLAFTGGGSGGHIYPGLAIIEALRARGFAGRIVWLGSKKELERRVVEAAGLEFIALPSGKLRRNLSVENAIDGFRVVAGFFAARRALRDLRPALLFSKGGYASVPPCAAAASLGIPYYTHESDLTPGLATRLNSRKADRVLVSYAETLALLTPSARERAIVAGNPVRAAIRAGDAAKGRAFLGAPAGLPVILFLGGSQGARQVNELAVAALPRLTEAAFVVHQTGEAAGGGNSVAPNAPRYRAFAYIREEMPDVLAAADLVIGRAGAGTLWESSALGKPMLLVPLCGSGTRGDQVDNAELFERAGAAIALVGADASPERLADEALGLLGDPGRLRAIGEAAKALAGGDSAGSIAQLLLGTIGEKP